MRRRHISIIIILITIPFVFCFFTSLVYLKTCTGNECKINNLVPLIGVGKDSSKSVKDADKSSEETNNSSSKSNQSCTGANCTNESDQNSNENGTASNNTSNDPSSQSQTDPSDSSCNVKDVSLVFTMGGGFDFSPVDKNLVAYSKPDSNGISQLHTRNLSTGLDTCLSCSNPNSPPSDLHKGIPSFTSDGKYIVLQVEMENHPFEDRLGYLGAGWFNNIWITKLDGSSWWKLTDYPHGDNDRYGVLFPKVSPDGEILAWGQLYSSDPTGVYQYSLGQFVPNTNPWGLWKLNIAELILGEDPHLSNITSERVGNGNFYETQGWSSDSSRLIFASDIGKDHPYRIDIWSYSVRTKDLQHLINTQNNWEEMAAYSPDNKKISYMSSACCSWIPGENAIPFRETLATELYIMDSNLKNKRKLTAFNVAGLPSNSIFGEKKNIRAIVAGQEWSSDGRSIYFEMPFYNKSDNKIAGSGLWKLEFEGNCGKK